jgi:hypothetical protein
MAEPKKLLAEESAGSDDEEADPMLASFKIILPFIPVAQDFGVGIEFCESTR